MVSEIVLFGFVGGFARAVAGIMKYGVRNPANGLERLVLLGIVGIVCAYAMVSAFPTANPVLIGAVGYAGADLMKSLYEIAGKAYLKV